MRFRLATSGAGGQQLTGGVGNFFRALALGPLAEQQGAEYGMRRQVAESQIANNMAQAAIRRREEEQLAQRPDTINLMGATRAGMSVPDFKTALSERTHGAPAEGPAFLPQPIEGLGPSGRTAGFDDAIQTLYGPAMATPADKTNWEQLSKARGNYKQQDVLDQVLAGQTDAGRAGQAVAASEGKKLIDNIGTSGVGYNQFTGEGEVLNEALRTLFGDQGKALVQQRKEAAGASGAQANLSTARKDRVVGGFDKPVTVIDDDTGEATITRLPTVGAPVSVGTAAKKGTGVDATNAKERNRVTTAVEKEMIGASDEEIQAEVDRRMARRGAKPGAKPAAAPGAPKIDMTTAASIKADFAAGKLTREQAKAKLQAIGFK